MNVGSTLGNVTNYNIGRGSDTCYKDVLDGLEKIFEINKKIIQMNLDELKIKNKSDSSIITECLNKWTSKKSQDIIQALVYKTFKNDCIITSDGILTCNPTVVKFMKSINKLGLKSVDGSIIQFSIGDVQDQFIILKYVRYYHKNFTFTLTYELFIGLILNQIREYIPNFVYTYGGMYCSIPLKNGYDISMLCTDKSTLTSMCLIEKVKGVTLDKFLENEENRSIEDLDMFFIQLFLTLYEADVMFGFRHNDLHTNNIMIAPNTENISIYYPASKYTVVKPKFISVLIDFGRSTLKYEGKVYDSGSGRLYRNENDVHKLNYIIKFYIKTFKPYKEYTRFFEFFNSEVVNNSFEAILNASLYKLMLDTAVQIIKSKPESIMKESIKTQSTKLETGLDKTQPINLDDS